MGHSQGEIAAAVVAGVLSVEEGARLVALRSRALTALSGKGGMVSVAASLDEVLRLIDSHQDALSVAAVNGPSSVVVSGEVAALDALLAACEADGVRARRIPVDYASHSAQVEEIRDEVEKAASGVVPRAPQVPFFSTVTGDPLEATGLEGDYWYRNLRLQVRFEDTIRVLLDEGFRQFVEISPHPVLLPGIEQTAEDHGEADVSVVGTLRRGEGGMERMLTSAAEAYVAGTPVEWARVLDGTGARRVALPTYPFQRRRYWLEQGSPADAAATGMDVVEHPLLDAGVPLPDSDGYLFTGRWSLRTHPWLADHAVRGRAVAPGTALVETALRAGDAVGCDLLAELTLESPVLLPEDGGALRVQVVVTGPQDDGRRAVTLHTCGADGDWTRHARGILTDGGHTEPAGLETWPPADAQTVETTGLYERLAASGLAYGPAFHGLETVWRRGEEIYADVTLPEDAGRVGDAFGLHPALLDAALHAWLACAGGESGEGGAVRLPFVWAGVSLHATGATRLRVRLTPVAGGGMSVLVADEAGRPVASAETLVTRPLGEEGLGGAPQNDGAPYRVDWTPAPAGSTELTAQSVAVVGTDGLGLDRLAQCHDDLASLGERVDSGACPVPEHVLAGVVSSPDDDVATAATSTARRALALVQSWLTDDRYAAARLVLVTRGAVPAGAGEGVSDLAAAPVWGLVRSAQTEHPGRFVLIDLDDDETSLTALPAALSTGEPQLAIRRGKTSVPRLTADRAVPQLPDGSWHLRAAPETGLDGLSPAPSDVATRPLGEHEVRIDVRAAGLNFRDVLLSLGMYPDADDVPMGSEGAGVVVEVGSRVSTVKVGDRVMGLAPGWFGDRTITDECVVVGVPLGWSWVEAASVPVAFVTALYALRELAGLGVGES
ncbi:acyltransferase domain-containing protein, partial [Streptomyces violaceusniger]|uniref:acyltransferase domain-containing protein n=1 Tax=Streptomyces violaceusniger TaxID=68280 RepID=UPI0031D28E41